MLAPTPVSITPPPSNKPQFPASPPTLDIPQTRLAYEIHLHLPKPPSNPRTHRLFNKPPLHLLHLPMRKSNIVGHPCTRHSSIHRSRCGRDNEFGK
ncbi:uncharacterized protein BDR25DRAFT_50977 [Lindgomyces ingoldianus]|uniref:Uncharacterized protein n=1 Tax=Lindgomyces ingoldianus TaxID=673940 RepID=A0ACB6QPZ0_9PLEO|nr:uncharacterized protein BDR25DRAFT_50977 [Lindgomyces ingoldianus]KAF2469079.1 hypothetical protein BDR25DRAFT_50977 [Lindgomyces ingoldianus]